jgi:Zn-dependent peptidase ImmA (M78 family)/transcriptional regulator with XRE-family HTH domain
MNRLRDILRRDSVDVEKLSTKTDIAVERLRALSEGANPTVSELRRLAEALRISIVDFASPNARERETDLLFRRAPVSGKPVPSGTVTRMSRRMASSFDLLLKANHKIGPWWSSRFEPGENTLESAERNAVVFRTLFCNDDQLSPLHSLPKVVVERMGVMVFVLRTPDLDGASAYLDGVPFVFISARFPPRMLFTLAHECGHLVAHHNPAESFAVIDETTNAEGPSSFNEANEERYANAFASSLLMPRASVGVALKKIREMAKIAQDAVGDVEIGYLARIFGVSFWAAARRCEDLALIPRGGAASLNEKLVKEYGSAEKRAEQVGLPPRQEVRFPPVPQTLLASAVERVRSGELSVGRAASILGLSIEDLMAANAPTPH